MGPVTYVIAILGCADGSAACAPVATVPAHYASQEACTAASGDALMTHSDLDFPTLRAECRPVSARPVASPEPVKSPRQSLGLQG
jgi:hypothetical protein